uniref:Piwi domain-containing protein n=1 Tax=Panagrellus redivivus TaxID=6233 RepID=A0A7E4VAQ2_PANRE
MHHRSGSSSSRSGGPYDRRDSGDHNPDRSGSSGRGGYGGRGSGGGYGGRGNGGGGGGGGYGGRGSGGGDRNPGAGPVLPLNSLGRGVINVPPTLPVVTPKTVQCNATLLDLRKAKPIYQYELKLKGFKMRPGKKDEEGTEIFRAANNDGSKNAKYLAFNDIFRILLEENPTFFRSEEKDGKDYKHLYAFDRSCLFYCTLDLLEKKVERLFTIETSKIKYEFRSFVAQFKKIEIRLVQTGLLDVKNVRNLNPAEQRPILQFLDILFDQEAYKSNLFHVFGHKMFFRESHIPIETKDGKSFNDSYGLKTGLQKSVRATKEGLVLQVDAKQSVFYVPLPLFKFLEYQGVPKDALMDPKHKGRVLKLLRGLMVETVHLDKKRTFVIAKLTDRAAKDITFEYGPDRRKISVAKYYEEHYKPLEEPGFICVDNRRSIYPLEVLQVVAGQRVPREKQEDQLTAIMIKQCQTAPSKLIEEITENSGKAGFRNNPIVKASGVRLSTPIIVNGEEIPKPAIVYKDNVQQLLRGANWTQACQFTQSGRVNRMAVVIADDLKHNDPEAYARKIQKDARDLGLTIRDYKLIDMPSSERYHGESIRRFAIGLANEGFDLLLFLGDSKELHAGIKFSELQTRVVTQQIKISSMKKGRDTSQNILRKTNLKTGGCNHEIATAPINLKAFSGVDIIRSLLGNTVIVGVEMVHPAPMTRHERMEKVDCPDPICVGIACTHNSKANIKHGGEYFYIPRGTDTIRHSKLAENCIEAVKEFHVNEQRYPKNLLILRGGKSEGSFDDVIQTECGAVVQALQKANITCNTTMLVVQRQTNHRIFLPQAELTHRKNAQCEEQNVTPGTCITAGITNANYPEFIMMAHRPILGTAKPIVGTLIFESTKGSLSLDQLKHLTHALCYHNEHITAPTALPNILRCATQQAQRGFNNWKYALKHGHLPEPTLTLTPAEREALTADQEYDMIQGILDRNFPELRNKIRSSRFYA